MAKRKKKSGGIQLRRILGIVSFLVALIILVSLITHAALDDARITGRVDGHLNPFDLQFRNQAGMLGAYIAYSLNVIFGWLAFFLPIGLILVSLRLFSSEMATRLELSGSLLFGLAFLGTVIYNVHLLDKATIGYETGAIGGYLGVAVTEVCLKLIGSIGTYIVAGGLVLILLVTFTPIMRLLSIRFTVPRIRFPGQLFRAVGVAARSVLSLNWLRGSGERQEEEADESEEPWVRESVEPETSEPEPTEPGLGTGESQVGGLHLSRPRSAQRSTPRGRHRESR
jgi:hypothetical protein